MVAGFRQRKKYCCETWRGLTALDTNFRVDASHPSHRENEGAAKSVCSEDNEDGGGGRIRTFEVDDGRFTVCSLWPLGNPTTGLTHSAC